MENSNHRKITLGGYSDGYYQVLDGLTEGSKIVTSAQFLIDSESNLKAAVSQFKSDDKSKVPEKKDLIENNKDSHSGHEEPSPLIRTGVIDLKAIDKNKDGKVYQDLMDWNVLSDEPGDCPICNMVLQQVSLETASKNLIKNGFKVK